MSAKRSNSRPTGRKPMSAYAKLRKQHYDKQYRLDIAVFGHSRWGERMREVGRVDEDGTYTQLRNELGQFIPGYRRPQHTSKRELDLFLDDLVGAPSSIRFCQCCRHSTRNCKCWGELPKYDFRLKTPIDLPDCKSYDFSSFSDTLTPGVAQMLQDIRENAPEALSEALVSIAKALDTKEES